jgi:hypothetical protein
MHTLAYRPHAIENGWEPPALRADIEPLLVAGDAFDDGTEISLIRFIDGPHPEAAVRVIDRPASELRLTLGAGRFGLLTIAECVWRVREILMSFEDCFAADADG